MSGFSFMSEERDSDVADNARPTVSGFGFISGNRTESDTSEGPGGFMASLSAEELAELKEQADQVSNEIERNREGNAHGSSGFGGLGGVQEEASEDERSGDGGGTSGFGFLGGSSSTDSHEEGVSSQTPHEKEEVESSPSLLETMPPPTLLPEVVQQPVSTPAVHSPTQSSTQAVKLASSSTASHKVVKKKKRTSKVGAQRHAEVEKEVESPSSPLSRISESSSPSTITPVPEVKAKEEVKVEPQTQPQPQPPVVPISPPTPPPVTVASSITPQTTETTPNPTPSPQKVVHLSDKPPISNSPSPHVKPVEKDSMSDISEDNSVCSSVSASPTSKKKKKKGGFMSYFSRKKEVEVVEEKRPSESSSQPYRPNTKAAKELVVQNPVTHEESPVLSAASTPTTQLSPSHSSGNTWQKPESSVSTPTTPPVTSAPVVEVSREERTEEVPSPVKKVEKAPPPEPQREPTPPPAGPKSILVQDDELCCKIKELSKDVISGFQTSAQDIAAYQETLLQDMSEFQKQKEKAEIKCRQLLQQIQDMEIEQNHLAEKEEFEQADILTGQLETLQHEYAANIELDKQALVSYKEAEASLKDCRLELSKKMHETAQGLGNLIRQQVEELNNMVTANLQALSDEDSRVSVEEERIAMELQHVSREETTLEEETAVIENAILAQTSDVQRDKEEMDMELMGVTCEVERLEAELVQKKQEQKMLEMNLLVAEGKIREVRRKYDRQLQRISDRSMTIRAASEECAQDKEVIEAQRSHFMSEKSKLTGMESDIATFIHAMENERDLTMTLRETFDSVLVNAASHSIENKSGGDDSDATVLRNKVIAEETVLEKAIAALENTRQSVSALNDESADLKEKVPVLEVEKKGHASNKRFKEAAAVAKEIKAMVARQEEISELVVTQEGQVGPQEQAIEEARAKLAVVQAELTAAERVADLAEFEALLTEMKSLRIAIGAAEKAKASSDSDNVMAGVAVELLSSELQVLLDQASEIKVKHGLDDELLPPLEDDEELTSTSKDDDEPDNKEGDSDGDNASGGDDNDEQSQSSASKEDTQKSDEEAPVEQSTEENDDDGDNDDNDEGSEEAKQTKITRAQAMLESIKSLEAELEVAVDTEEYDTAATISEQVDELTEQLDKLLLTLSWTRQELEASVE